MNDEVLKCIFGDHYKSVHVTSFLDDPTNIPQSRRAFCWSGRHYNDTPLPDGNQYFTVSRFNSVNGRAVRRKAEFIATYVIVLDDVIEKLPKDQVDLLPFPTFKIQTSSYSQQWFWALTTPCTDKDKIDNLHDGFIRSSLVPDSNDPGQKGVTRYSRLPDGYNSKASRAVNGLSFRCRLIDFAPWQKTTVEELAFSFNIDLEAKRKNKSSSNDAKDVEHLLLEVVTVKAAKSSGVYDITCPWINQHTANDDSGTAVFTNADLSLGFKCHHGHCEKKTGKHLIEWIEQRNPGWGKKLNQWQVEKRMTDHTNTNTPTNLSQPNEIKNPISDNVFVADQNKFYDTKKRIWFSVEAFKNMFCHIDRKILEAALIDQKVKKVDSIDYRPGLKSIFQDGETTYVNSWKSWNRPLRKDNISIWLDHFDKMGWSENKKHIIQWMAYTIRFPDQKINHSLIFAGSEGNGKDFLIFPLMKYLKRDAKTVHGDVMGEAFNDYLMSTKLLVVNELHLASARDSANLTNKLKPLSCSPPDELRVNQKGLTPIYVKNIVNVIYTSNSAQPIRLDDPTRRYYALWSDYNVRDETGNITEEEYNYWAENWEWIKDEEGWQCIINYLLTFPLGDFSPGQTPLKTEFTRQIESISEDPIYAVIRSMIDMKVGKFSKDLLTSKDIHDELKNAFFHGFTIKVVPPVNTVGKIMRQSRLGKYVRAPSKRLWVVRNSKEYESLNPKELFEKYISL